MNEETKQLSQMRPEVIESMDNLTLLHVDVLSKTDNPPSLPSTQISSLSNTNDRVDNVSNDKSELHSIILQMQNEIKLLKNQNVNKSLRYQNTKQPSSRKMHNIQYREIEKDSTLQHIVGLKEHVPTIVRIAKLPSQGIKQMQHLKTRKEVVLIFASSMNDGIG